jgi:opacity protein-like surface antigen
MLSGYLDLSGSFFSSESEDVLVWVEGVGTFEAEKRISQYNIALHAGLQLGSDTRRGAIRPRFAFAPGLYLFNTETTVTMWDAEDPFLDDSDAQVKFGWRGIVGCDFFLTTRWGISTEFVYDQVINLHHETEYDELGRPNPVTKSARFHGFMVGVVFAMK